MNMLLIEIFGSPVVQLICVVQSCVCVILHQFLRNSPKKAVKLFPLGPVPQVPIGSNQELTEVDNFNKCCLSSR